MKELLILWKRYLYTDDTTIGKLFIEYDGKSEFFGYTLEDTVRGTDIKVMECTAIPAGYKYRVSKFKNDHYGETLIIHTEMDGITIKAGLLTWVGCLFHNGLNKDHTSGCVLVGAQRTSNKTISQGLKEKLASFVYQKISEGYTIYAMAMNEPQLQ
jgi:hypothetical protein